VNIASIHANLHAWLSSASLSNTDEIVALLRRNRMASQCVISNGIMPDGCSWTAAIPQLELVYQSTLVRGMRAVQTLKPLAAALEAHAIPWMVMRGPFLAVELHDDPGAREFADIDLFVHPSRRWDALGAARAAGWRLEHTIPPAGFYARYHLHWRLVHPDHDIPCELHWAFDPPTGPYKIDIAGVLDRTRLVNLHEWAWRAPAPVDQFLLMMLHMHKHLRHMPPPDNGPAMFANGTARYWFDMACMATALSCPAVWDTVGQQAAEWNLQSVLHYAVTGLRNFNAFAGIPVANYALTDTAYGDLSVLPMPAPWFRRLAHIGGFSPDRWYDLIQNGKSRRRGVIDRIAAAFRLSGMGCELLCYAIVRSVAGAMDATLRAREVAR
jgi:hypothetical protein